MATGHLLCMFRRAAACRDIAPPRGLGLITGDGPPGYGALDVSFVSLPSDPLQPLNDGWSGGLLGSTAHLAHIDRLPTAGSRVPGSCACKSAKTQVGRAVGRAVGRREVELSGGIGGRWGSRAAGRSGGRSGEIALPRRPRLRASALVPGCGHSAGSDPVADPKLLRGTVKQILCVATRVEPLVTSPGADPPVAARGFAWQISVAPMSVEIGALLIEVALRAPLAEKRIARSPSLPSMAPAEVGGPGKALRRGGVKSGSNTGLLVVVLETGFLCCSTSWPPPSVTDSPAPEPPGLATWAYDA